jgi:predicted TIM-barrel fold metal-dependent hydrolase
MTLPVFDADQHYYEAQDAFTRYASERMKKEKFVRWVTEADGKRKRLLVGDRMASTIGNPTFDPVALPGTMHEMLKKLDAGASLGAMHYDKLEPLRVEYQDKDRRLAVMTEQGVDRTLMFPTLGVTMEGYFSDDVELLYDAIRAFNRWQADDWGFHYQDRIFCAGYVSLLDLDCAITELEWLLANGCRVITIRPGPAYGRSPADPYFDRFWARVEEAGVLVAYHSFEGASKVRDAFRALWAAPPQPYRREHQMLERAIAAEDRSIMDTLSALVLHNLFGRFPKIRVGAIELGSAWLPYLMKRLDHGGLDGRPVTSFGKLLDGRPSEILRRHVWIAPFPEDDVKEIVQLMGADRVLMGSDWPHAESTPTPRAYLASLDGLDEAATRRVVHDNLAELVPI